MNEFKKGDNVECLVMGKGIVSKVTDSNVFVDFNNNIVVYGLNGEFINTKGEMLNKTLFKDSVLIVTNNVIFDINRTPIKNKDIVLYGKKDSVEFNAMMYNSENNELIGNNRSIDLNRINKDVVLFRLPEQENSFFDSIRDKASNINNSEHIENDVICDNNIGIETESSEDINNESDTSEIIIKTADNVNEEKDNILEDNLNKSLEIFMDNAEIVSISDTSIINKINNNTIVFNEKPITGNVTFMVKESSNIETYITLSGVGENVVKRSIAKQNPKDYIEIFDAWVKKIKGSTEDESITLGHDKIGLKIEDDKIRIYLK